MEDDMDGDKKLDLQSLNGVTQAVHKHRILLDNTKAQMDLDQAQDEWDAVCTVLPDGKYTQSQGTCLISSEEAVNHFKNADLSCHMDKIVPCIDRPKFYSFFRLFFGPTKLNPNLDDERKLVFAIACCPFQNDEIVHLRVLQTIYKQLTNTVVDSPRLGPHWESIGFQGNDPSTDLRGVGFLGLIHLLHFVMNPFTLILARDILKLSNHEIQNFPFAVMGINLTRIVLQTLREDRLNRECNRNNNVVNVTNDFYVGIFLHLYNIWRRSGVTIEKSGWVLKDVESFAKKKPKQVFRDLENYIAEKKKCYDSSTDESSKKTNSAESKDGGDQSNKLPTIFKELESEIKYADEEFFI